MLISQIKMYQKGGRYHCTIKHSGHEVESGWFQYASEAYSAAESKLIYKPGYVRPIRWSER